MANKLVYIEWVDSHGCVGSWTPLEDFKSSLPVMKSVGWVVFENDKLFTVCGNIADETESTAYQGNGLMTIPKQAVLTIQELTV